VIVPTRHRPRDLRRCLEALASLDYPRESFEVIVVDDGGSSPLDELVASFEDRIDVRVVQQPWSGAGAARNLGAGDARGALLAFTDDDCLPERGWLRALAEGAGADAARAVGGRTLNAREANRYSRVSQLVLDIAYAHYNTAPEDPHFFTSNNLAVPAAGFRDLGGFDPDLPTAEDRDLCDRWLRRGNRMVYAPDAVLHHAADLSFAGFVRKHFRYGQGAFRFQSEVAPSERRRAVVGFYAALPGTLRRVHGERRGDAGLLVVWQLANTAGFAWEALSAVARRIHGGVSRRAV
jgi:glycosyltransferase involved in cell wall biosynthesis